MNKHIEDVLNYLSAYGKDIMCDYALHTPSAFGCEEEVAKGVDFLKSIGKDKVIDLFDNCQYICASGGSLLLELFRKDVDLLKDDDYVTDYQYPCLQPNMSYHFAMDAAEGHYFYIICLDDCAWYISTYGGIPKITVTRYSIQEADLLLSEIVKCNSLAYQKLFEIPDGCNDDVLDYDKCELRYLTLPLSEINVELLQTIHTGIFNYPVWTR